MKQGLRYYHIDTDKYQDRKIKKLKKTFGVAGVAIYDYVLCEIYRVEGCGLVWDEDTAFDVAEYWGVKENLVKEIVKYCGVVGLFDSALLTSGILTSASIQRRYLEMCKKCRRSDARIPEKWAIITEEMPKTTEELPNTPTITAITTEEMPKTLPKIKESKIKENKREGDNAPAPASPDFEEDNLFKKFTRWCEFYAPLAIQFKEPLTEEQFMGLYQKHGAAKLKQCALDLHNKEACLTMRSAIISWNKYLKNI